MAPGNPRESPRRSLAKRPRVARRRQRVGHKGTRQAYQLPKGPPESVEHKGTREPPRLQERTPESVEHNPEAGSKNGRESRVPYNGREVASEYSKKMTVIFKEVGSDLEGRGCVGLKWQSDTICGMLEVVVDQPERVLPLLIEFQDFMDELLSGSGSTVSQESQTVPPSTDAAVDSDADFLRGILGKLLTSKVPQDLLKMIAHLSIPREWTLSLELSANMIIFGGKGSCIR